MTTLEQSKSYTLVNDQKLIKDIENFLKYIQEKYKGKVSVKWIKRRLQVLREIENLKDIKEFKKHREYFHTINDLKDLQFIFENLDFTSQDRKILKLKLQKVFKGRLIASEETMSNNEAKNTLFELRLCALFKGKLCDPNPDFSVAVTNKDTTRNYHFQCKRIFSQNVQSIKKNIMLAANQLKEHLKNQNDFGIIAVSLDRCMTDGGKNLLDVSNAILPEISAIQRIDKELQVIINKVKSIHEHIENEKILAIIYESSLIAIDGNNCPRPLEHRIIHEIFRPKETISLFQLFKQDFSHTLQQQSTTINPSIYIAKPKLLIASHPKIFQAYKIPKNNLHILP